MTATYFSGGSETQADHLQTLYLMNPSYAGTYSDAPQHLLVGIPLSQPGSGNPGADLSRRPSSFHEIQGSAAGGPRFHYNLWGAADPSSSACERRIRRRWTPLEEVVSMADSETGGAHGEKEKEKAKAEIAGDEDGASNGVITTVKVGDQQLMKTEDPDAPQPLLVGIPLSQPGSGNPGADRSRRPSSFHEIQGSAAGGSRFHYNLWGAADPPSSASEPYELETVNSFGGSNSEMKMPVEVNNQGGAATAAKRSSLSKGFVLLFIIFCLFAFIHTAEASAYKRRRHPPAHKPQVVLVHGFSSGGFGWFKTRYILEMAGYNVTAIDLKASGLDPTDISMVDTFEQYNEPLDRFMTQLPEEEKVVVVGGSAGGVSVTKILHDHPQKVLVAIYLSATMLKYGYVTCEDLEMGLPGFIGSPCHSSCPSLPKPTCFEKAALGWRKIPLKDQTEDYTLGKSVARPGPLRAIVTANFTEAAQKSSRIDKVPRVYIKTRLDQVLVPAQQNAMVKLWPPCEVIKINNGHDTPFTKPQLLFELIVNATLYSPIK